MNRKGLAELQRIAEEVAAESFCPSISWGVVADGVLAHHGSVGKLDDGTAPTADTVYRIASMTKSFTAAAVLAMRDEGVWSLDDPVARHAPELGTVVGPAGSPPITLRQLLSMTSGLATDDAWVKIKQRISALLDVLEKSGLFVLRRGSIESYYQHSDCFTSIGKPSAAADEMEYISQLDKTAIQAPYADIFRCVQFASNAESICEADALRDLLLSVAAPAHARLKTGESAKDFNLLARSILGERSKIFDLAVKDGSIVISIASKILSVDGFPLTISKDDDVVKIVTSALASNA